MLSYLQRNYTVSLAYCIKLHIFLTLPWDSLMPSMIARLILSLKKASVSPGSVRSNASSGRLGTAIFAQRTASGTGRVKSDDVALSNLSSEGTSGLSRNDDQNI